MLNEKVGTGIGILACYVVAVILCAVVVGFMAAPAVWIWGMVAANNDAHKWNRAPASCLSCYDRAAAAH
jgi:hypothetical protein